MSPRAVAIVVAVVDVDRKGFPHITSLWFRFRQGRFWCCTQQQSAVCRNVHRDSRVGFEVAVNEPPYRGASGKGTARICEGDREDTKALLNELMDQYLGDRDPKLKAWLLSRVATEAIIEVIPTHLPSWDFRNPG